MAVVLPALSAPPQLQLELSSSPLLNPIDPLFRVNITERPPSQCVSVSYSGFSTPVLSPVATSSAFASAASLGSTIFGDIVHPPLHLPRSLPQITITRPLSDVCPEKPLPGHPYFSTSLCEPETTSPNSTIALFDLINKINRDMTAEVDRVTKSIKDARTYVAEWREERRMRGLEHIQRREEERNEMKGLDSEVWFTV